MPRMEADYFGKMLYISILIWSNYFLLLLHNFIIYIMNLRIPNL